MISKIKLSKNDESDISKPYSDTHVDAIGCSGRKMKISSGFNADETDKLRKLLKNTLFLVLSVRALKLLT